MLIILYNIHILLMDDAIWRQIEYYMTPLGLNVVSSKRCILSQLQLSAHTKVQN